MREAIGVVRKLRRPMNGNLYDWVGIVGWSGSLPHPARGMCFHIRALSSSTTSIDSHPLRRLRENRPGDPERQPYSRIVGRSTYGCADLNRS
jgi:hypothetical protein